MGIEADVRQPIGFVIATGMITGVHITEGERHGAEHTKHEPAWPGEITQNKIEHCCYHCYYN